jgi:hypothetical protein
MEVQTAPPAPSKPPVLSAPIPTQISSAQAAPTSPAAPAHPVQAAAATPTVSHMPAHPIPSTPPAQPAQAAALSTKTTVTHSPAPTISHVPGPVAPPASSEATPPVVDTSAARSSEEELIVIEIAQLWTKHLAAQASFEKNTEEHTKAQGSFRKSRAELKDLRDKLSKLLHELKPLISRPGRSGGWSSFLVDQRIPRSTADGLIRKREKMLAANGEANCPSRQIVDSPETAIRRYLQGLWPKLSQVVNTPEELEMFITALKETAEKTFAATADSSTSPAS